MYSYATVMETLFKGACGLGTSSPRLFQFSEPTIGIRKRVFGTRYTLSMDSYPHIFKLCSCGQLSYL